MMAEQPLITVPPPEQAKEVRRLDVPARSRFRRPRTTRESRLPVRMRMQIKKRKTA